MASTVYVLEYDEAPKSKKVLLGAFTTMDKAIDAGEAHMNWVAAEVGGKPNFMVHAQGKSYYEVEVFKTGYSSFYSINKVRLR